MTPSQPRAWLVYLGDATSPHGYIWLTRDKVKPNSTWSATARATARTLYHVPASTAIRIELATRLCDAIRKRRDKLRGPGYPGRTVAESFADSWRAAYQARHAVICRRLTREQGANRTMSPGGVGLL